VREPPRPSLVMRLALAILLAALAPPSGVAVVTPSESPPAIVAIAPSPIPPIAPPAPNAEPPVAAAAPPADIGGPIPDGYRIRVPRLGIDLPIAEGDLARDVQRQRTPEGYAFHLPGTGIPGRNGNTFLYAHARSGMFLALWEARPGDDVFVLGPTGEILAYVVRDVLPRVAPTDLSATRPTTIEQLTLQTSTGPNPSDPRFVVLAFPRGG